MTADKGKATTRAPTSDRTPSIQTVARQLSFLRNMGFLLALACLVVSVCFNVYVLNENAGLKAKVKNGDRLAETHNRLRAFGSRLARELMVLGRDDPQVRQLTYKYGNELVMFRLLPYRPPPPMAPNP